MCVDVCGVVVSLTPTHSRINSLTFSSFLLSLRLGVCVQGSENRIKLRFSLDFDIGPGSSFILTGLVGSPTKDGFLRIEELDGGLFGNNATWKQSNGSLYLQVPESSFIWKATGDHISISFVIM